jgi:flagellar biosynthesis/type III secretory pathway chaperone
MKITKQQLRQIIQEEKSKLQEVEYHGDPLGDIVKEAMAILRSMDPMERNPRIYEIIDELEDLAARG